MATDEENAALNAQAKTQAQENKDRFFALAKKFEDLKNQLKAAKEELSGAMHEFYIDQYLQDPATGVVYKIVEPEGTFVEFPKIAYKRTAVKDERGGSYLSKKDVEEAGFVLKKS